MKPSHAGLSERSGKEEQPFSWLWEFAFLRLVNYVVRSVFPHSCRLFQPLPGYYWWFLTPATMNLQTGGNPMPTTLLLPMSLIMSKLLFPFPAQPGLSASYEDTDWIKGYYEVISTATQQPRSRGFFFLKI